MMRAPLFTARVMRVVSSGVSAAVIIVALFSAAWRSCSEEMEGSEDAEEPEGTEGVTGVVGWDEAEEMVEVEEILGEGRIGEGGMEEGGIEGLEGMVGVGGIRRGESRSWVLPMRVIVLLL